jgi:ATP-dependent RNA helicase DHX57
VSAHVAASKSDHLAVVAAYNSWRAVVEKEGRAAAHEFCARGFLADQALEVGGCLNECGAGCVGLG